jgi:hypothetical protein
MIEILDTDKIQEWLEQHPSQESKMVLALIQSLYHELDETEEYYVDIIEQIYSVKLRVKH